MRKKLLLVALASFLLVTCMADANETNSNNTRTVYLKHVKISHPHLLEPVVTYNSSASLLTINFANQPINNYIVTISTAQTNVDYYATSPYTTIPLVVDGISSYDITIETADGDVFERTLFANDTPPPEII